MPVFDIILAGRYINKASKQTYFPVKLQNTICNLQFAIHILQCQIYSVLVRYYGSKIHVYLTVRLNLQTVHYKVLCL